MIIDHVKVFTEDKKFTDGGIVIKNGTIEQVYTEGKRPQTEDEVLDGKGMYAIPVCFWKKIQIRNNTEFPECLLM